MPALYEGGVAVSDVHASCAALANALAELGVASLLLVTPDSGWRRLVARETDLPRTLAGAVAGGGAELLGEETALRITIDASGVAWCTEHEQIHRHLADRLG